MSNSIFEKQNSDRVNSPEDLNDYIKTSGVKSWLVVGAAIVLLFSVLVWGIFGNLDTTVTLLGVKNGDTVHCYTPTLDSIKVGNAVTVDGAVGEVVYISEAPLSKEQLTAELNVDEYTLYQLNLSQWNYVIEIRLDGDAQDGFTVASIVTESISPISFIWN